MPSRKRQVVSYIKRRLMDRYFSSWGRRWPHGDDYLAELWYDSKGKCDSTEDRIQFTLETMRECDEFNPSDFKPLEPMQCTHP